MIRPTLIPLSYKRGGSFEPGLNQRPSDLQSEALPAELPKDEEELGSGEAHTGLDVAPEESSVFDEGVEPSTNRLKVCRSSTELIE